MTKLWTLLALSFVAGSSAFAGFPIDYRPVSYDEALARAAKDGKPVMVFFSHEN